MREAYRTNIVGQWKGIRPGNPMSPIPRRLRLRMWLKVALESHFRKAFELERIHSLAFIPLVYEGRLLGKFMVYYDSPHQFTAEELRIGHAIAGPVGYGVERKKSALALAEAKRQLEEHTKNLERAVAERTAKLRESIEELESFSLQSFARYAGAVEGDHQLFRDSGNAFWHSARLRGQGASGPGHQFGSPTGSAYTRCTGL